MTALRPVSQQTRHDCRDLPLIVDVCLPELRTHVVFFEPELAPQRSEPNRECNQPAHFRHDQGIASECDQQSGVDRVARNSVWSGGY